MEFPNLRTLKIFLVSLVVGLSAFGCAHTVVVEIPPKIDLQSYKTIGIVEFSSNSRESLNQIATQKFMGVIQNAQPQVRFLELGPEDQLVKKLGRNSLDIEAIKAIEKKYGVSSIFTGSFEISDVKAQGEYRDRPFFRPRVRGCEYLDGFQALGYRERGDDLEQFASRTLEGSRHQFQLQRHLVQREHSRRPIRSLPRRARLCGNRSFQASL